MPELDPQVAKVLDRHNPTANPDSDEDEDALIAALEEDDSGDDAALAGFREQRLQQLHSEFTRAKAARETGAGTYTELKDEKAVLDLTTSVQRCVVHFMKPDFARCGVMDGKLESLAPKHFDTRFLSINVDNAPFLVAKLKIQVLPCVIAFVDGIAVDRIIGFEGLGKRPDSFTLQDLEARLLQSGVLVRAKVTAGDEGRITGRKQAVQDEDDDDWD
ncbi:thioredoxin-like protein [Myriangium duriaei CBS 260.36]|uniref:Thioredoxin-like protein n=1 Tax=Myriangium duriaei CBS 260.36 TaxID=1168546 RepID=A0A9P4MKX4_9PEZI|nr:thioredoxin-like protein [Myriangium duriaei CBS 260.36]